MYSDAAKAVGVDGRMRVVDVVQLVEMAVGGPADPQRQDAEVPA